MVLWEVQIGAAHWQLCLFQDESLGCARSPQQPMPPLSCTYDAQQTHNCSRTYFGSCLICFSSSRYSCLAGTTKLLSAADAEAATTACVNAAAAVALLGLKERMALEKKSIRRDWTPLCCVRCV